MPEGNQNNMPDLERQGGGTPPPTETTPPPVRTFKDVQCDILQKRHEFVSEQDQTKKRELNTELDNLYQEQWDFVRQYSAGLDEVREDLRSLDRLGQRRQLTDSVILSERRRAEAYSRQEDQEYLIHHDDKIRKFHGVKEFYYKDQLKALQKRVDREREEREREQNLRKLDAQKRRELLEKDTILQRRSITGINYDQHLDIFSNMGSFKFKQEETGTLSFDPYFNGPAVAESNDVPGHEEDIKTREFYRATTILSEAGYLKRLRVGDIDFLIPKPDIANLEKLLPITRLTQREYNSLVSFPGVSFLLTEYVRAAVLHRKLETGRRDERFTLQECPDEATYKRIREQMVLKLFSANGLTAEERRRRQASLKEKVDKQNGREVDIFYNLDFKSARMAESIAYTLVFVTNIIESADSPHCLPLSPGIYKKYFENSRYGMKHDDDPDIRIINGRETLVFPKLPNSNNFDRSLPGSKNLVPSIGSGDFRDFCDPLAKALDKISKPEGWGAYKGWASARIAKTRDLSQVKEEIEKAYPEKLGISFFEWKGKKGSTYLDNIFIGTDDRKGFELKDSENPFVVYYVTLAKLKGIFQLFSSDKDRMNPTESKYRDGEAVSNKVNNLLLSLGEQDNQELKRQMIYAIYHDDRAKKIEIPKTSSYSEKAFRNGLKGS